MSQMTTGLSHRRDALFHSPSAEMLPSQVSIPCQVLRPAHQYACCYAWNSVHLLVGLLSSRGRQDVPRPKARETTQDLLTGRKGPPESSGHVDAPLWLWMNLCVQFTQYRPSQHIIGVIFKVTPFGNLPLCPLMGMWICQGAKNCDSPLRVNLLKVNLHSP